MSHRDPNIHLTFYPNPDFTDEDQNLGGRVGKKIEAAMVQPKQLAKPTCWRTLPAASLAWVAFSVAIWEAELAESLV